MSTLRQIRDWSTTHHPRWLVVLRVALGICLFAKGIVFMSNSILLERLLSGSPMSGNALSENFDEGVGFRWSLPGRISWEASS